MAPRVSSTTGSDHLPHFSHFPIKEQPHSELIYVDYNEPATPRFSDVPSLIRYYTLYVMMRYGENGSAEPDVFPWWNVVR